MLGIRLTDTDIFDVPLLATDVYGNIILGPNGYAQIVTNNGLIEGVAGGLDLNSLPGGATVARTHHAFLDDIAHNAVPGTLYDTDNDPATPGTSVVQGDADNVAGYATPSPRTTAAARSRTTTSCSTRTSSRAMDAATKTSD